MLDAETKRRIDTARDILVGKVPDPKSQVEQITIALIYKFMDDMDGDAEDLGGDRQFFADGFSEYGWSRLIRSGLGGYEVLNLYAEAITRMPENPGIPPLFRDIFKNAYLPYRDPETLRSFLKVIDEFTYDHSERLGDAFEYLLSVLGSQGDAGQFRTPRHIIDFIVEVVDPQKDERILDPACGTAGFLIAAYKHILGANTDEAGELTLTLDEKGGLAGNLVGYDISPDMVRLSLVNLYLHGFVDPHIWEYDTLTSEDKWNEMADVILANPPFMSPKGGIRPHQRFSVGSKRSEVLFVDYIAEHLTPRGRAGIIVPEGVIFQSQNAYRQLRRMLVDSALVAVVSLPGGVFNPYSGVKTSILILDKALAKRSDSIAFFKVANDGFDLGAQRRPIDKNDLPQVRDEIKEWLYRLRSGESGGNFALELGLIVSKEKIAGDEEYNLGGDRYRESKVRDARFPIVKLGDIAEVIAGQSPPGKSYNEKGNGIPFYQGKSEFTETFISSPKKWTTDPQRFAQKGDILMSVRAPVGPVNLTDEHICIGRGLAAIRPKSHTFLTLYAFYFLKSQEKNIKGNTGAAFASINKSDIENIKIPLPPLGVQREIVAEIEGYQKVIDGARAVVDNYRPHIPIDPEWPMVELGEVCEKILSGGTPSTKVEKYWDGDIPWITSADIVNIKTARPRKFITNKAIEESATNLIPEGNIVVVTRVGLGKLFSNDFDLCISQDSQGLILKNNVAADFLVYVLRPMVQKFKVQSQGTTIQGVTKKTLASIQVPLPPLSVQQAIVAELEAEQALVTANRKLVERMEGKIEAAIARVWEG